MIADVSYLWSDHGRWYAVQSGELGNLSLFGIFGVLYHRLICHTPRCYRIGKHDLAGTPLTMCRKHHPDVT